MVPDVPEHHCRGIPVLRSPWRRGGERSGGQELRRAQGHEDAHRIGFELYYTGRQSLEDNPYRGESRSYLVVGLLGERVVPTALGRARIFLNAENLLDVRQTRVDPLLLPEPGMGGRRTTDVWSLLRGVR